VSKDIGEPTRDEPSGVVFGMETGRKKSIKGGEGECLKALVRGKTLERRMKHGASFFGGQTSNSDASI